MRDRNECTSRRVPTTPPNAFDAAFLELVQVGEEPLTAAEADLAGPWKLEPHPDHPGVVAVLRSWETLEKGDQPEALFLHEETAALATLLLPLIEREPRFHLDDQPAPTAPLPGGYPVVAIYGGQGAQVTGWLRRYHPEIMAALHLLESIVRSPHHLAELARVAGGGALTQFGRVLAELLAERSQCAGPGGDGDAEP